MSAQFFLATVKRPSGFTAVKIKLNAKINEMCCCVWIAGTGGSYTSGGGGTGCYGNGCGGGGGSGGYGGGGTSRVNYKLNSSEGNLKAVLKNCVQCITLIMPGYMDNSPVVPTEAMYMYM